MAWDPRPSSKCSRRNWARHYIPAIPTDFAADLAVALALADAADALTMPRFRARDLHVETKPDLTPVSEADRSVEAALRERLAKDRPDDGVLGEELGEAGAGAARRWIVDPIDGTMSYVRGVPVWATLIALEADGEMSVGVVSAPALGRRWWGAKGLGAFADGEAIQVSEIHALEDAHVCAPNERYFESGNRPRPTGLVDGWRTITRRAWRLVGFADFWGHMLVAEGAIDVIVSGHDPQSADTKRLPFAEAAFGAVDVVAHPVGDPLRELLSRQPARGFEREVGEERAGAVEAGQLAASGVLLAAPDAPAPPAEAAAAAKVTATASINGADVVYGKRSAREGVDLVFRVDDLAAGYHRTKIAPAG